MATQNKKFTKVLLAGIFIGGAVAFAYACGGDDAAQPVPPVTGSGGAAGAAGAPGTGGDGTPNAGGGGSAGAGTGGNAGAGTGGGDGGMIPCQASGPFDNVKAKTVFPADGGVPAL